MSNYFGVDQIFVDVSSIEAGDEFPQAIEKAVTNCDLLIAVIGKQWLSSSTDSGRRLDDPNDFVRKEIVTALERNIRVIPVLVQGATMPREQDLPAAMASLAHRQAIDLRDGSWKQDVASLINKIKKAVSKESTVAKPTTQPFWSALKGNSFAIILAIAIITLTSIGIWWAISSNSSSTTTSTQATPRPTVPVVVMPASSTTHTMTRSDRVIYEDFNFSVKLDDDKPVEQGRVVLWFRYPSDASVKLTPGNYFELSRDNRLKTERQLVDVNSAHQFSLAEVGNFTVKIGKPLFGDNNELRSVEISITRANQ